MDEIHLLLSANIRDFCRSVILPGGRFTASAKAGLSHSVNATSAIGSSMRVTGSFPLRAGIAFLLVIRTQEACETNTATLSSSLPR